MKKQMIAFFLFASICTVTAKEEAIVSLDLHSSLEAYKQAILTNDLDGITSYIYPGFFKRISRETFKKHLKEISAKGIGYKITSFNFTVIGVVRTYSKGKFVFVKISKDMEYERPDYYTPNSDKLIAEAIKKDSLDESTYVTIDKENSVYKVRGMVNKLLVLNEDQKGWKVLTEMRLKGLLYLKLLPEDLVAKLQQGFQ